MHDFRRSLAGRVAGLAALLALAAPDADAARRDRDKRSTLSRNTAGGGDFPTWEREVESDERSPLPEGREGRFVPAWTAELGATATGVAAIGGTFVVPLEDGRIRLLDAEGGDARLIESVGRVSLPPTPAGALVLVAAGERLVAVGAQGVAWTSAAGGRIVRPAAVAGEAAYVAREGGTIQRLSLADGRVEWETVPGGETAAGPAAGSRFVAIGILGEVVGFDAATGAEAFRVMLGDRVDSVLVSESMLYATGAGISGRSRDVVPVMAGWALRAAGPASDPWRLRVGGSCPGLGTLVDENVVFTCADGYVRAVGRRKGVGGWKTDLPAASTAGPVVSGGRLDFFIPQSRHAVALQADNGAVIGWITLPDEDETFVGTAASAGGITASVTSFQRLVAWSWEWAPDEEDGEREKHVRPGEDEEDLQRRGVGFPIQR